jgi:hypothetical protein
MGVAGLGLGFGDDEDASWVQRVESEEASGDAERSQAVSVVLGYGCDGVFFKGFGVIELGSGFGYDDDVSWGQSNPCRTAAMP